MPLSFYLVVALQDAKHFPLPQRHQTVVIFRRDVDHELVRNLGHGDTGDALEADAALALAVVGGEEVVFRANTTRLATVRRLSTEERESAQVCTYE